MLTAWAGRLDLMEPDEGRHAEIAREMVATGHLLTPRLHGKPYYDKPPAFHWLVAASLATFGPGAMAARLPSLLAALWTVLITAWWASRAWGPATGRLAALLLSSTVLLMAMARWTVVDMLFTASLSTAFACLGCWLLDPGRRPRTPWPFYFTVGVATLVKGPAAIVLGGGLALACVALFGGTTMLRRLRPVRGGLLTLAVATPWYLAAWLAEPEYIETFLFTHNLGRYAFAGAVGHQQPWTYYLLALPLALLPWIFYLPDALAGQVLARGRKKAAVFAALWAAVVVGFFLPSSTRLVTYMLPAFPPLAALTAAWLVDRARANQGLPRRIAVMQMTWTGITCLLACTAAIYLAWSGEVSITRCLALGLGPLVTLPLARRGLRDRDSQATVLAGVLSSTVLVTTAWGLAPEFINSQRSLRPAALQLLASAPAERELLAYKASGHSLAFYAKRLLARDDNPQAVADKLAQKPAPLLLTKSKYLFELGKLPPRIEIVWTGARGKVLLAEKGGSRTLHRP